jgi:hypothetical protein
LAAARSEVVGLHRRLEHSEALRAELEGHLFESGARDEAAELVRLRREVVAARERGVALESALTHLRTRAEELVASRDTLLARFAEWRHSLAKGDTDAVDLAEFIAGLRSEILELEQHNMVVERREADLRDQLERAEGSPSASVPPRLRASPPAPAGVPHADPGETAAPATDADVAPLPGAPHVASRAGAQDPEGQIAMLLRLGRSGDPEAAHAIRRSAAATEPLVRAAAYEALGRLLQRDPSRLEPVLSSREGSPTRIRVFGVAWSSRPLWRAGWPSGRSSSRTRPIQTHRCGVS